MNDDNKSKTPNGDKFTPLDLSGDENSPDIDLLKGEPETIDFAEEVESDNPETLSE